MSAASRAAPALGLCRRGLHLRPRRVARARAGAQAPGTFVKCSDVGRLAGTRALSGGARGRELPADFAACLAELPGEVRTFRARDTGRDEASLAQLRCSAAAPAELKLKAGAQVILTKTLDAASGLVNGARGRVLRFLATQNPVVRFGGVEHVLRMEQFSLSQGGQTIASRTQLPLAHGWGARRHFEPRMAGARPGFRPPPPPTPLTLPPSHPLHVARPSAHAPVYPLRCPTRHSAEHP